MGKRPADILFWSLAVLGASMLGALLLVVGGVVSLAAPSDPSTSATEVAPAPEPLPQTTETVTDSSESTESPEPETPAAATTTTSAPAPPSTLVVVTASRGDSWFSARLGSASGRVLDERVLPQGESVRLRGERIWLTVGAAGNVDLTVNGKPRDIEPGTVELVLTRPASAAS